jgi:DNA-binding MarR family transcriptional regulator
MSIIKQLGEAGIPFRLKRITDGISRDVLSRYRECCFDAEPAWLPILLLLKENELCSVQDIASSLGISHPATVQFIQKMEKRNVIQHSSHKSDKRKKMIGLTNHGLDIIEKIVPVQKEIEAAFQRLNNDTKIDLITTLDKIEESISQRSFYKRIIDSYKEKAIKDVEILSYNKSLNKIFKELNYEWLQKYFEIEEIDKRILNDPEKEIIKKGGEIFFARINGEIVGTCAAIKTDKKTYELAKMAVTEKARGKQAGRKLALAVIGFAWSKKTKYVTLLTSNKLAEAVNLYKSLGFETDPNYKDTTYKRKVFKMVMEL